MRLAFRPSPDMSTPRSVPPSPPANAWVAPPLQCCHIRQPARHCQRCRHISSMLSQALAGGWRAGAGHFMWGTEPPRYGANRFQKGDFATNRTGGNLLALSFQLRTHPVYLCNTITALWPPKPKELFITTFRFAGVGSVMMFRSISGSGVS